MGKTTKKKPVTAKRPKASTSGTCTKPRNDSDELGTYKKRTIIKVLQANNCNPNLSEAFEKQCKKIPFDTIKSEYLGLRRLATRILEFGS